MIGPHTGLYGSVLFGADQEVIETVRKLLPGVTAHDRDESKFHTALGVVKDGQIVGGVIYYNFRGHDIEVAAAFIGKRWASRHTLKMLFGYPFNQLGCLRASATTARKNKAARQILEKMGCKIEGVKRRGFDGRQDAILYGLLRQDCRWLGEHNG